MNATTTERGILTFAQGKRAYIDMAVTFAQSVRLTNPGTTLAVITDRDHPELRGLYDHVIPHRDDCGSGFVEKLYIHKYSPFEKTLYIDADMLVLRSIEFLWRKLEGRCFTALARKILQSGNWYGDVASHCRAFGLPALHTLNGGLMYFESGEPATRFFEATLALVPRYEEFGLVRNRGQEADEPLLAVVMQRLGLPLLDDASHEIMGSPMDCAWLEIDALAGRGRFETEGTLYDPAIMHFSAGYWDYFHYRRERLKIRLAYRCPWLSRRAITCCVNGILNPAYVLEIAGRRVLRRALRGTPIPRGDWMPVSRYK